MTVFDANTFGPDEVPVPTKSSRGGHSEDVLIDLNGERRDFRVGWYDHHEGAWLFHQDGVYESKTMRWSFLPLAIYDTNPELRKTVKL